MMVFDYGLMDMDSIEHDEANHPTFVKFCRLSSRNAFLDEGDGF